MSRQTKYLILIAVLFFFIYAWFPFATSQDGEIRFSSPDGTANFFWAERIAAGEELSYYEPLNILADDIIIPRSARSDNGTVKPVSFLGIILIYGWLAKIFGSLSASGGWIIIYLTPLFAVLGAWCFYSIIKKIFDGRTAFISFLLLLVLAPYWYYSSRSMFHNALFVDLILISIFLLLKNGTRIKRIKQIFTDWSLLFISGIFMGLAIMTRTSELIWLAPAIIIVGIFYFKQIKFDKIILFFCGIIIALLPMFYYNQVLYGDCFSFGYVSNSEQDREVSSPSADEEGTGVVLTFDSASSFDGIPAFAGMTERILPFGFHPRLALNNFLNYYVIMYWYLFWPALFGGIYILWNHKKIPKQQLLYFGLFCAISIILVSFYGSWAIQDNINPNSITIGNSYTRYWLAMYLMSIPLAVIFLWWFFSFFAGMTKKIRGNDKMMVVGMTIFIILFLTLSANQVLSGEEGLIKMKENMERDKKSAQGVVGQIEDNAIIITKHFDKYLWPKYRVIVDNLSDIGKYQHYTGILEHDIELYYYGFVFTPEALELINNNQMFEAGLQIEEVELDEENKLGLYKLQVASNK